MNEKIIPEILNRKSSVCFSSESISPEELDYSLKQQNGPRPQGICNLGKLYSSAKKMILIKMF